MKNIAAALLKVQQGLEPVHKGRKGYGYTYADLPAVINSCIDTLNANGVLLLQPPVTSDKQVAAVETRLIHVESGEEVTSKIEVPYGEQAKLSAAQVYGSALTYARRYALVAMLGIVTEDDDGASAGKRPQRVDVAPNDGESRAVDWALGYVEWRAGESDKVGLDGENSAKIAAAMKYPKARDILVKAGVPE